jgi:lipopolysaccharide transport system ATP-binding protein
MALIEFSNVCVDFPVYNASGRSLKKNLMQVATGGRIGSDNGGRVVVRSIDNLNFTLTDGERVGLIGHNGAGKSTLLRLLSGVYYPTGGTVHREGNVGSLIDISLGIDPEATGRENIFLRGGLLGMTKRDIQLAFDSIVTFSELGDFVDMPLRTYSSGMHLRLAFAVSTLLRPEILLMDEWLSVGDEHFKHKAEARLKDLVQSSNILVIASHDRELVQDVCTRVLWLEHGRIRADGRPEEVLQAYFG